MSVNVIEINGNEIVVGNSKLRKEATLFTFNDACGAFVTTGKTINLDDVTFTDERGRTYKKGLRVYPLALDVNDLRVKDKYLMQPDGTIKRFDKTVDDEKE
jgi:hypothetical protein